MDRGLPQPAPLLPGGTVLPDISQVILKVVGPCNIDCSYCYVYHGHDSGHLRRPPLLTPELTDQVVRSLRDYCAKRPGHRISICLHGGEPLMMGKQRLLSLVKQLREGLGNCLGSLSLQTNAVLIDAGWAALIRDARLSVSISLDGSARQHDRHRRDHRGRGTHDRTVAGIGWLLEAGVRVSVLCVATPGEDGAEAYRSIRALGVKDLDFLLPDVSHDDWTARFGQLPALSLARFLQSAMEAWLAEDDPGVSVRFLADIFSLVMGGGQETDAFGGGPMPYAVIETDGSIEANDALRVCADGLNATGLSVNHHDFDDLAGAPMLIRKLMRGEMGLPTACRACPDREICGGGYMPHRYSSSNGFDNPSVWCDDIRALFAIARQRLSTDRVDLPRSPGSEC